MNATTNSTAGAMKPLLSLCVVSSLVIGCAESRSPTAPTTAVVIVQTPAPVVTNYAGHWRGFYIVEACSGSSGSMGDVLCSEVRPGNPGGVFKLGTSLPASLELTQNGSTISGVLGIGSTRGTVSGAVRPNHALFLSGGSTGSASGVVINTTLTTWNSFLQGPQMFGTIEFRITVNVYPGDGVVRGRLSNMTR